jgi:hypothetical protein
MDSQVQSAQVLHHPSLPAGLEGTYHAVAAACPAPSPSETPAAADTIMLGTLKTIMLGTLKTAADV